MSSQKTENQLISGLLDGEITIEKLLQSNFEPTHLKYNAEIYEWILTYYQTNNKLPTQDLTVTRYPQFNYTKAEDSVTEIVDALRKGSEYDRFVSDLNQVGTLLAKTGNVETVKNFLVSRLENYESTTEQDVFDLSQNEDIDLLFKLFEERKRKLTEEGYVGIPTGFGSEFDVWLNGGSQGGNLYGILAPLGVGKTWSMMTIGAAALEYKKSPFMLMLEGNLEKEGYRALTTVTNISNSGLHTATHQNSDVALAVAQFQKKTKSNGIHYWLALHGNRAVYTPFILRQKIAKYKPDLVIVDYLSLMGLQDSYNKLNDEWKIVSFMSRELKKLAVSYNIPIWVVLQGNRGSNSKDELTADDSSFYNSLRDFDTVVGLTRVPEMKYVIRLNGVKGRDSKDVFKALYRTNWDTGKVVFEQYLVEGEEF